MSTSSTTTTPAKPVEIFRSDYQPLEIVVEKINMDFDIRDGATVVRSELFLATNPNRNSDNSNSNDSNSKKDHDLVLDGDETSITLLSVELNGVPLLEGTKHSSNSDNSGAGYYALEPGKMTVFAPPPGSVLTTTVRIVPEDNTQLSGLYKSGSMYCSQCEAMGFRRITYYPDRPDNVSS
jgi:aminopeptidase N